MDVGRGLGVAIGRTLAVTLGCSIVTLVVVLLPQVHFAYADRDAKIATETAGAMIAGFASALLFARFSRSQLLRDLLLAHAMALLALGGALVVATPGALSSATSVGTWGPLLSRLAAAALIAAAAAVRERRVRHVPGARTEAALLLAFLAAVTLLVHLLPVPDLVVVLPSASASGQPRLDPHPLLLASHVVNLLCFAYAATALVALVRDAGDAFVSWLGTAFVLGAFSRLHYLLYPSGYTPLVYTGDVLRVGFFLVVLVGCVRELQAHWRSQVETAAEQERRRLARDLHDGVMQELGYLRSQASLIPDPDLRDRVRGAAERGLDESRRALRTLVSEVPASTPTAVREAVCDVGDRYDVPVELVIEEPFDEVDGRQREAIVRIAREAVSNAARHAAPRTVRVLLRTGELRVCDDGRGFDLMSARVGGFGLTSMRDRAEGFGGRLEVHSALGRGTEVLLRWV